MKYRKNKLLSIFAAILMLATSFLAIGSASAQSAYSHSLVSFSFPYSYGTPQVPSDVGAQGTQGPTVPTSQIGNRTGSGSNVKFYPPTAPPSTVTFDVFNGTVQSSVYAQRKAEGCSNPPLS